MKEFKRKLDAAGVVNTLTNLGTSLSLRFKDQNGLILEFMAKVKRSLVYERTSRSSAHSDLQRWLLQRESGWLHRSSDENSTRTISTIGLG